MKRIFALGVLLCGLNAFAEVTDVLPTEGLTNLALVEKVWVVSTEPRITLTSVYNTEVTPADATASTSSLYLTVYSNGAEFDTMAVYPLYASIIDVTGATFDAKTGILNFTWISRAQDLSDILHASRLHLTTMLEEVKNATPDDKTIESAVGLEEVGL